MLPGPLVFVDIDTQRDFLDPRGRLYVEGSASILPKLSRLTRFAQKNQIPILATACAHQPDDPEFQQHPPHCLVGTSGQRRIPETEVEGTQLFLPGMMLEGIVPPHLTFEKQHIDFFSQPECERLIHWYNQNQSTFVVYGVATDYCVKAMLDGLLSRKCGTALVVDAVRAIEADAETGHLTEFASRGTLLTLTEIVCEK